MLRKMIVVLVVLYFLNSTITSAQNQTAKAIKFDEFGDIYSSDLKARLDNFAVQLASEPTAKGFLMVYRARRDSPGINIRLGLRIQEYMVMTRGISKDRIVAVDAGVASSLVQELWIVPPNTAPTPRADAEIGFIYAPDEAWEFLDYQYLTPEEIRRFGMSNSYYIDDQYLAAFVEQVNKKRTNTACVIVYAQYNPKGELVDYTGEYEPVKATRLDPPGAARTRLLREANVLTKQLGLSPARLKIIDGGYRKRRSIELWVVPAGEALPVATPNSYPRNSKGSSR